MLKNVKPRNAQSRLSRYSTIATMLLAVLAVVPTARGQAIVDLNAFRDCTKCLIATPRETRLPASGGVKELEGGAWAVSDQRGGYIAALNARTLGVFDHTGKLRHALALGERAQPFGTIRAIGVMGDSIVIMDGAGQAWMVLDRSGRLIAHMAMPEGGDDFVPVGSGRVVVAGLSLSAASVGFPLHLVSLAGRDVRHFGSREGEFNVADPWARKVLLATGNPGQSVWFARPGELQFEEWLLDGTVRTIVRGSPVWFPRVEQLPAEGEKPPTRLRQFALDDQRRLWVLSREASPAWKVAIQQSAKSKEGERFVDPSRYLATRVDVFDLSNGVHVGPMRWPNIDARLLRVNGSVLLQSVDTGSAAHSAAISIHRLEIRQPKERVPQ